MSCDSYEAKVQAEGQQRQLERRTRERKLSAAKIDEQALFNIVKGQLGVQIEKWQFGITSSIGPSDIAPTWDGISGEQPQKVKSQLQDFAIYRTDRYIEGQAATGGATFMRFYFVGRGEAEGAIIEVTGKANADGETFTVMENHKYTLEGDLPSHLSWLRPEQPKRNARKNLLMLLGKC